MILIHQINSSAMGLYFLTLSYFDDGRVGGRLLSSPKFFLFVGRLILLSTVVVSKRGGCFFPRLLDILTGWGSLSEPNSSMIPYLLLRFAISVVSRRPLEMATSARNINLIYLNEITQSGHHPLRHCVPWGKPTQQPK